MPDKVINQNQDHKIKPQHLQEDPTPSGQTKFEQQLQAFFPDVYQLHVYGKSDKKIWSIVEAVVSMRQRDSYGEVVIKINGGKIQTVYQNVRIDESL